MARFCARCGTTYDGTIPFIENLCIKCWINMHNILEYPNIIVLEYCRNCGVVRVGTTWTRLSNDLRESLKILLLRNVKVRYREYFDDVEVCCDEIPLIDGEFIVAITAKAKIGGYVIEQPSSVRVRVHGVICSLCSRKALGTYNAIVQVRSVRGSLSRSERRTVNNI